MRARTMATIAATTAVILGGTAASATAAERGGAAVGSCAWQTLTAPTPPGFTTPPGQSDIVDLTGVSALSDRDVWFGGGDWPNGPGSWFLHWNGHAVSSPAQPSLIPSAQPRGSAFPPAFFPPGSSFDSDSDGWQLMPDQSPLNPDLTTAQHWQDGQWTLTPMAVSPDPAHKGLRFDAVASVSPGDAWAVGALYAIGPGHLFGTTVVGALIEHWDGTAWSIVPNPADSQPGAILHAISVVSPTDIWAVGQQGNPSQIGPAGHKPFIEHWDGSTWSVVAAPTASKPSWLYAVSADSSTDAWAVGYQTEAGTSTLVPLAEHWNGTAWAVVPFPGGGTNLNGLRAVYAASPDDVWAVQGGAQYLDGPRPAVFLHWNGTSWTTVPQPGPAGYGLGYQYEAISGTGPDDVWAVGAVATGYPAGNYLPLIAHLNCRPEDR